jgi:hypothetical protein
VDLTHKLAMTCDVSSTVSLDDTTSVQTTSVRVIVSVSVSFNIRVNVSVHLLPSARVKWHC